MFDTLNMWVDRANCNPFDVAKYIDGAETQCNQTTGEIYGKGTIKGYTVSYNQNGISLKGSLSNYFFPSNIFTHTRATIKQAIEQMSDSLHIDINKAQANRLDASTIIATVNEPTAYYSGLGNKRYYSRLRTSATTLEYRTKKRDLAFYDKTKEANAKGLIIPDNLIGCNMLRYELRLINRLQSQLQTSDKPTIEMLCNERIYAKIVSLWANEFMSINKTKTLSNMNEINTPKEASELLFARLLSEGGQDTINGFIDELKAQNRFADKKYYSRLASHLNSIRLKGQDSANTELIKELETSVIEIAKYSR